MTPYAELMSILNGEECEGVMFGDMSSVADRVPDDWPKVVGQLLTLDDAVEYMSYHMHCCYPSHELPPMYVWTPTRVLVVGRFDGATWFQVVPRHPSTQEEPSYIGGGT